MTLETENAKSTNDLLEMILAQVTANGQQNTEMIANLQLVMQQVRETEKQAEEARRQAEKAQQQATASQEEIASMKKTLQGMQAQMGEMKTTIAEQGKQITQQQGQIDKQGEQIAELQKTTELLEAKDPQLTRQAVEQETMKLGSEVKNVQLHFFKDDILDGGMYLIQQDAETLESESILPKEIIEQLKKGNTVTLNDETIVPVMKENKDTGELRLYGMVTGEVIVEESGRQNFAEVVNNRRNVMENILVVAEKTHGEKIATHDPLTGLYNKNGYARYLQEDVLNALQNGETISMVLIDGDKFKDINETYGHEAGDAVLKAISETMQKYSGENACVARDGGDEFLIILPCDGVEAYKIGENIRHSIEEMLIPTVNKQNEEVMVQTTISAGITEFAPENPSKDNILNQFKESKRVADERLSNAKGNGQSGVDKYGRAIQSRNVIVASPEIEKQARESEHEIPKKEKIGQVKDFLEEEIQVYCGNQGVYLPDFRENDCVSQEFLLEKFNEYQEQVNSGNDSHGSFNAYFDDQTKEMAKEKAEAQLIEGIIEDAGEVNLNFQNAVENYLETNENALQEAGLQEIDIPSGSLTDREYYLNLVLQTGTEREAETYSDTNAIREFYGNCLLDGQSMDNFQVECGDDNALTYLIHQQEHTVQEVAECLCTEEKPENPFIEEVAYELKETHDAGVESPKMNATVYAKGDEVMDILNKVAHGEDYLEISENTKIRLSEYSFGITPETAVVFPTSMVETVHGAEDYIRDCGEISVGYDAPVLVEENLNDVREYIEEQNQNHDMQKG